MQHQFDTTSEALPIFQRRLIPHPTVELPLSPPATPPGLQKGLFVGMTSASSIDAEHGQTAAHRHAYPAISTPDLAGDSTPASPLALPPLLHPSDNDDDVEGFSPSSSTGILTPPLGSTVDRARIVGDHHNALNRLSFSATPDFSAHSGFDNSNKPAYPLLPAHHALRSKAGTSSSTSTISLDNSPPSTPKGHPISSFHRQSSSFFPLTMTGATAAQSARSALGGGSSHNQPSFSTTLMQTPTVRNLLSRYTRIPRRYRPLLLLGFCVMTFFCIILTPSSDVSASMSGAAALNRLAVGRRYLRSNGQSIAQFAKAQLPVVSPTGATRPSAVHGAKPLEFQTKEEELAALIAYITSTTSNSLPPLDPMQTLDAEVILDFDPTRPTAREDLALLQDEVNTLYPLVVIGKMRDPWHREIKKMLAEYRITPSPLIIDVDQRKDHLLFVPLLARLLGTSDLPQVLVQGKSLGSYHDVLELREQGVLASTLEDTGAMSVKLAKKKKKGVKEAQRMEDELVLAPKPIFVS